MSRRKKCDLRRSSATFTTASWSACKTGQIDVGEAEEACSKLPRLQLFPRRGRLARCSYATQIAFNTHHIHPSGSQRVVPDANAITSLQKLVVFQPLSRTWFVSPGETGAISAVRSPHITDNDIPKPHLTFMRTWVLVLSNNASVVLAS